MCGITRLEDALAAVRAGSDALGFIFWRSSPRYVEPDAARAIIRQVGPFVTAVGVFVNPAKEGVEEVVRVSGVNALQFHGEESPEFCGGFGLPYVKAFKVGQGGDLLESTGRYGDAAGWLFDAFDPRLVGGTGEAFDWSLVPDNPARPLVLSGGLHAGNVGEAIRSVRPFAVDVSSGIEAGKGIKDADKMIAFVHGVRNADQ
jgi:phosphoribosylanthranilate isomerase